MTDDFRLEFEAAKLSLHVFRVCCQANKGELTDSSFSVPIIPFVLHKQFSELPREWKIVKILYTKPYFFPYKAGGCIFTNSLQRKHVIAFRGTYRLVEWQNNLHIRMKPIEIGPNSESFEVHQGYWDLFTTCLESIHQFIKNNFESENFELVFTGHSLGGALATLAAIWCKVLHPTLRISLITFGTPRCVSPAVAQWIQNHIYHAVSYERATDPVPVTLSNWSGAVIAGARRELSSFGHRWWMYPLCHDVIHYHRAMCTVWSVPYTPIATWDCMYGLQWLGSLMTPPTAE